MEKRSPEAVPMEDTLDLVTRGQPVRRIHLVSTLAVLDLLPGGSAVLGLYQILPLTLLLSCGGGIGDIRGITGIVSPIKSATVLHPKLR